jgi:hypothetical protein
MVFEPLWCQYWYISIYLGRKTKEATEAPAKSEKTKKKLEERSKDRVIDPKVAE